MSAKSHGARRALLAAVTARPASRRLPGTFPGSGWRWRAATSGCSFPKMPGAPPGARVARLSTKTPLGDHGCGAWCGDASGLHFVSQLVQVPPHERLDGALRYGREGARFVGDGPDAREVVLAELPVLLAGRLPHGRHPLGVVVDALHGVLADEKADLHVREVRRCRQHAGRHGVVAVGVGPEVREGDDAEAARRGVLEVAHERRHEAAVEALGEEAFLKR